MKELKRFAEILIGCAVLLSSVGIPASSLAQDITLQLIDAKTGKPLKSLHVQMRAWDGEPHVPSRPGPTPKVENFQATTDSEGRAVFHLPGPVPDNLGFDFGGPDVLRGCSAKIFLTADVLRTGVIADYSVKSCGKLKRQASAQPGEVIIFEKKTTGWDRFLQELF
jgi:hypothetical protein